MSNGEDSRRKPKSCIACHLGKRKCSHERPCGPCCSRGLQCLDEVKQVPCTTCKKYKVKCDRKRPCRSQPAATSENCRRCYRQGRASQCVFEGELERPQLPLNPDSDIMGRGAELPDMWDKQIVPMSSTSIALHRGPSTIDSESSETQIGPSIVSPEHPVAFPGGTINGFCHLVPPMGQANPWPKSLVQMFKMYRAGDAIYQPMLLNMTPKLLATVLRIFGAIDVLGLAERASKPSEPPREWTESPVWQSSMRCGMQMVRIDKNAFFMTGVDVNPFWTDFAGLHKEEFVSRAFNCDMNLPTSELRQFCKLVLGVLAVLKLKFRQRTDPTARLKMKPMYCRFSRHWGRGGATNAGVLVRMQTSQVAVTSADADPSTSTSTSDQPDSPWWYVRNTIVIISPEEFEAVRAQQPELCEGYLVPIVGPKSATELMDGRLLVEESFHEMKRSVEGRAQLNKLAEWLEDEFRFMFDFATENKIPMPSTVAEPVV